jgi:hypothetical protein
MLIRIPRLSPKERLPGTHWVGFALGALAEFLTISPLSSN